MSDFDVYEWITKHHGKRLSVEDPRRFRPESPLFMMTLTDGEHSVTWCVYRVAVDYAHYPRDFIAHTIKCMRAEMRREKYGVLQA